MKIHIAENTLIREVQFEFTNFFPCLRLEFFRRQPDEETRIHFLQPDLNIGDATYNLQEGCVYLSDGMTAEELEGIFADRFGLNVQIFRKCGNAPRTSLSGSATLKAGNGLACANH
jgi:hypothetical protein